MASRTIHVSGDRASLAKEASLRVAELAEKSIAARGEFHMALAGGETPRQLYSQLATSGLDLAHWHIWFGDERHVPHSHAASNFLMARESLLDTAEFPNDRVHPFPTDLPPDEAAEAYAREMLAHLPSNANEAVPRFDLVLLGMGTDGHTASLFPTDTQPHPSEALVVPVEAPGTAHRRLTLALPVLNAARNVLFLIAGSNKASMLAEILGGESKLPAAEVCPNSGGLEFFVDAAAAKSLDITPA